MDVMMAYALEEYLRLNPVFHAAGFTAVLMVTAGTSSAAPVLFTGSFANDSGVALFVLNVTASGTLTAQSVGYGGWLSPAVNAGGFATSLSLYDGNAGAGFGNQLANDFLGGTAVGAGCSNGALQDATTDFCEDALVSFPLAIGTYYLTLSEQGNDGPGLLGSLPAINPTDFPLTPGSNFSPGPFNDPGAIPGTFTRNGNGALLIDAPGSVSQVGAVPEPGTWVLSSLGLLSFALIKARSRKRTTTLA
jgi:hypothetical protein